VITVKLFAMFDLYLKKTPVEMKCMLNFHIYNVIQNVVSQRRSKCKSFFYLMAKNLIW